MSLANMINTDSDALLCDLAETYHIFNINEFSPLVIARFSVGLRDSSRIKMKMANVRYTLKEILLMSVLDRLSIIAWQNTKDAQSGKNMPKSLVNTLLQPNNNDEEVTSFTSSLEFEKARNEILKKGD